MTRNMNKVADRAHWDPHALRERTKNYLRDIKLLDGTNAHLKAAALERNTRRVHRHYDSSAGRSTSQRSATALTWACDRLRARGVALRPKDAGALRILWIGANYSQDHTGFVQGLERFGTVELFHNEEEGYGLLLPSKHDPLRPVAEARAANDRQLQRYITQARAGQVFDVVMGQMWSHLVSVESLRRIQAAGMPVLNVSMDDRLPINWPLRRSAPASGSVGLANGLDLVLTSSPEVCRWYEVEGCPAIYWPMASDPELFRPWPEANKMYDVSFIGNRYGMRGKLISDLSDAGVDVAAFGNGWPNGPVGPAAAAEILGRSRIILGVGTIGHSRRLVTLKLRDFDATMAGAAYVTTYNPELSLLFRDGVELAMYRSPDECVELVRQLLASPAKRITMGQAAAVRAREQHTWEHRFRSLFSDLGLLPETR